MRRLVLKQLIGNCNRANPRYKFSKVINPSRRIYLYIFLIKFLVKCKV